MADTFRDWPVGAAVWRQGSLGHRPNPGRRNLEAAIEDLQDDRSVRGADFDQHDGQLQLTGAEAHLQRDVQAIRRLRDYGYSRVIVTTDHGFFHWDPEEQEMEEQPGGKLLWLSRRAMVGRNLSHPRAPHLQVPVPTWRSWCLGA